MRLMLALVAAAAAGTVGCTAPDYGNGHLQCAPSSVCPSGFYCAGDEHCWLDGSGPAGADLGIAPLPSDLAGLILDLAGSDLSSPPSTCANSARLVCEGFEKPLVLSGWSGTGSNGLPSIDTTRAFRGKSSLKSHLNGGAAMSSPLATVSGSKGLPISGTLYARVWVYFPSPLPAPPNLFLNLTDAGSTGVSVATDSGAVTLDDYDGALYQRSLTQMPLDRWACVQLDLTQGMPAGAIHIYVDGNLLGDLTQAGATPTAVNLVLGLDFDANKVAIPQYDAWFDELIVDDKPISCSD